MNILLRTFSPARLFAIAIVIVLVWGWQAHLDRYLAPERGVGYALGVIGGSMMVLLLIYPARKRARWLAFVGGVPGWFKVHMVLGTLGPVCILFHSNFSLGATNSNVALFCMLTVAGSGVIGRYLYTRLHARLDGGRSDIGELRAIAERLRTQTSSIALLPELLGAIDREESRLLSRASVGAAALPYALTIGVRSALARRRLRQLIRRQVALAVQTTPALAAHARRLAQTAEGYAARRLDATRRVAEFSIYTQLFSLWHVLHVPLFIMLLIAGIVHVVSAQLY